MFPIAEERNCTGAHCSMLTLSTGMCATKAAMTFQFATERRFPMPVEPDTYSIFVKRFYSGVRYSCAF